MRVVVTGAGGFVGRRLVARLDGHEVVAIDQAPPESVAEFDHVTALTGDLCDSSVLDAAFSGGCDAVVHLATVPGGAAERQPALAKKVNVDGTMALGDAAVSAGQCPRFIFASSVAVFGNPLPSRVNDATPLTPRMYYGAHKAMIEQWLATLTRRGALQALSLRLSGVVARPPGPSGMKSAFLSEVFHALIAGRNFVMPVSPGATSWVISLDRAVDNLLHGLELDMRSVGHDHAVNLPTLRVNMSDLVAEIALQTGADSEQIFYEPDRAIMAAFGSLPPIDTTAAEALGFANDGDLESLVARVVARLGAASDDLNALVGEH